MYLKDSQVEVGSQVVEVCAAARWLATSTAMDVANAHIDPLLALIFLSCQSSALYKAGVIALSQTATQTLPASYKETRIKQRQRGGDNNSTDRTIGGSRLRLVRRVRRRDCIVSYCMGGLYRRSATSLSTTTLTVRTGLKIGTQRHRQNGNKVTFLFWFAVTRGNRLSWRGVARWCSDWRAR